MTPLLSVRHVSKVFRATPVDVRVLKDVSFEIERGTFMALVGPSGSGKTTLLTLLGCLDQPSEGAILFDNREIIHFSRSQLAEERLRHLGFIFQDYNLIPTLTALENVEYVLWLQGVRGRARRLEATKVLQRVGLGPFLHRRPNRLSRGQQQRVAVSRAIVHHPKLVLGDEITANLDRRTGMDLMDFLKQLNQKDGMTFLYATHDPVMMERAGRVLELEDGVILRDSGRDHAP